MLKKTILSKYQRSRLNLWLTARKLRHFYSYSFARPEVPNIPWTFLRWEHHIMTYLWDIHEEIGMLDVIQEDTTELKALYSQLQGLLDFAI